jgi:hypothetical protein
MPAFTAGTADNELFATGTTGPSGFASNYVIVGPDTLYSAVYDQNSYGVNGGGWGMAQLLSSENPTYVTLPGGALAGVYHAYWYDDEFTTWRDAEFTVEGGVEPPPPAANSGAAFLPILRRRG